MTHEPSPDINALAQAFAENWRETRPHTVLPPDWQAENRAAAAVALQVLAEAGGTIDLASEEQRQAAGTAIHEAWLERNPWARGSELDVPFEQLSATEQLKDIEQIRIANELSGSN